MADYHVVSRERHGSKYWQKHSSYAFAVDEILCPLVAEELPKAVLALPIGFVADGEHFAPVAVQGLTLGQNLYVAGDGQWLTSYVPARYRSYPFQVVPNDQSELLLCIDEGSGLISDISGDFFFDADGKPSESVAKIMDFFHQVEANRKLTLEVVDVLKQHGLIQPWLITIEDEQGEQTLHGLFRIDEAALNALSAEALAAVRDAGGLTVAYCQLLSMQHLATLGTLAQAHAEAKKGQLAQEALAEKGELHQGFMNDSGTFSFGQ